MRRFIESDQIFENIKKSAKNYKNGAKFSARELSYLGAGFAEVCGDLRNAAGIPSTPSEETAHASIARECEGARDVLRSAQTLKRPGRARPLPAASRQEPARRCGAPRRLRGRLEPPRTADA